MVVIMKTIELGLVIAGAVVLFVWRAKALWQGRRG
jgi:hypothetical protein